MATCSAGLLKPVFPDWTEPVRRYRFPVTVQDVRVEIDPTRPAHRSGDRVDAGAVERCVIVDCSKYTWERIVEVQLSHQAIGEDDAQEAITEVLNAGNTGRTSHCSSLLKQLAASLHASLEIDQSWSSWSSGRRLTRIRASLTTTTAP